jgi:hypothetical protein
MGPLNLGSKEQGEDYLLGNSIYLSQEKLEIT